MHLFRKICAAVAFCHENQIIHCDIKPNNILVNNEGVPKLLDFGIARFLQKQAVAHDPTDGETLQFSGAYASPEQLKRGGIINARSDVYSLGVLLYELLTERHPFRLDKLKPNTYRRLKEYRSCSANSNRPRLILEAIEGMKPIKPSRIIKRRDASSLSSKQIFNRFRTWWNLVGSVDSIVLKAINQDPSHRYATAHEFGTDVENALTRRPVNALSHSKTYFLWKSVSNRFVLALTAFVLVIVWLAYRAYTKELQADQSYREARAAIDDLTNISEDELDNRPGMKPLRLKLQTKALAYYQSFTRQRGSDTTIKPDLAKAYYRQGMIIRQIGKRKKRWHHLMKQYAYTENWRMAMATGRTSLNSLQPISKSVGYTLISATFKNP